MGLQNLACTYCRSRKIKCDRVRPVCQNCKRDDVDCEYASPSRRANHMKLLYQSVESLDNRLADFEDQIQQLARLLRDNRDASSPAAESSINRPCVLASRPDTSTPLKDSFVIRNPWLGCNVYYGPASLIASCKSLSHDLLDLQREQGTDSNCLEHLLEDLCMEVRTAPDFRGSLSWDAIRLPPRRVLDMVLNQFIAQAKTDYTLDVFSSQALAKSINTVYSQNDSPDFIAWSVCFNVIILLCLGSEQPSGPNSDPFLQPYIVAVQAAVHQLQLWMVPKLVNVQTLTLMSAVAQRYSAVDVADALFAQACVLAKTIGLHQAGFRAEHLTAEETAERQKVFRSLYIRDKSTSISRGSPLWLSGGECSIFVGPDVSATDEYQNFAMRVELADIQFECYRWLHSHRPFEKKGDQDAAFATLSSRLAHFAKVHKLPSGSCPDNLDDLDIHLSFLSTRIYLLSACAEPSKHNTEQLLTDARLACLLMLSPSHSELASFERIFNKTTAGIPATQKAAGTPTSSKSGSSKSLTSPAENSIPLHRLAITFPATSLVRLARNNILKDAGEDGKDDLWILNALSSSLQDLKTPSSANTYTHVLGQTLHKLLKVVELYNPHMGGSSTSASSGASTVCSGNDISYAEIALQSDSDTESTKFKRVRRDPSRFVPVGFHGLHRGDGLSDTTSLSIDPHNESWPHLAPFMEDHIDRRAPDATMDLDAHGPNNDQWDAGLWLMAMQQFPE